MNLEAFEPHRIEEVLYRHGAQAVTLTDAGDDPVLEPAPGSTPLWPDTRITALFPPDADFAGLRADLGVSLGVDTLPDNHVESLADRAWEREWLRDFRPMQFGKRLWVLPGDGAPPGDAAVVVRLDPGLAFGTGTHATTALCLDWLDGLDIAGKKVLDVGCGSGILGIAALKLGAASVEAVDIDPQALLATCRNARQNGVGERLRTAADIDAASLPCDVVVANILAGTLIGQASAIVDRLGAGGLLGLSGILSEQAEEVMAAYRPQVEFAAPLRRDGWALLTGRKT